MYVFIANFEEILLDLLTYNVIVIWKINWLGFFYDLNIVR